jgi:DNA-binding response OmpR family regulator
MKILILEDDGNRVNTFIEKFYIHDLTITENSYDAIDLLDKIVYDFIFLDCDLGDMNGSGSDVSAFLQSHPDNLNNQANIIIHSWNAPATKNMLKDIPYASWIPFNTGSFFEIEL